MSNLGMYQKIIEASKKVGGPLNLLGIVFGTGVASGVASKTIVDKILNKKNNNWVEINQEFEVTTVGQDDTGLIFEVGDFFRVILSDTDAVLIEKIKGEKNPYYVSNDFLKEISIPYSEYIEGQTSQK